MKFIVLKKTPFRRTFHLACSLYSTSNCDNSPSDYDVFDKQRQFVGSKFINLLHTKRCILLGHDTKAMRNNSGPRSKRSKLERDINWDVIACVFFLISLCLICAIGMYIIYITLFSLCYSYVHQCFGCILIPTKNFCCYFFFKITPDRPYA